ncbi:hypothetical protein ITP31_003937 [Salmonella enterica]|nr:hypothetical protein [Salmonella enterica]
MLKIDLSKTSKELLYAVLTETAGKAITDKDVSFANIASIQGAQAGQPNATVELSSVANSTVVKPGGTEPLTRKVTRHTLAECATALAVDLTIDDDITQYDTASYVVAKVNSLLGSVLTEAEVTVSAAAADNGVREVTVSMKDGAHIALHGDLVLIVTDNVDHRSTVEGTFPGDDLNGFDQPASA